MKDPPSPPSPKSQARHLPLSVPQVILIFIVTVTLSLTLVLTPPLCTVDSDAA